MNERVSSRLDLAELRRLLEANPVAYLSGVYRAHGKRALDVAMVPSSVMVFSASSPTPRPLA